MTDTAHLTINTRAIEESLAQVQATRAAARAESAGAVFLRLRDAVRQMTPAMERVAARVTTMVRSIRESANSPVRVAGLEARFHVRAALDPAYRDPDAIRGLVSRIMQAQVPELVLLDRENRARVAAAALTAWVEAYPDTEVPVLTWHRLLGSVPVVVTRG